MKGCEFFAGPLSDNDKREIELFTKYLERRAEHPDETPMRSYAEVYGEVVFDAAPAKDPAP